MTVTPITTLEQFRQITSEDKVVAIDFWAPWCGPCRVISPIFERFSNEFPSIGFYKVDVDEATDIAQELSIRAMPTFIFFKKGEKLGETVGANPGPLEALIKTHAGP